MLIRGAANDNNMFWQFPAFIPPQPAPQLEDKPLLTIYDQGKRLPRRDFLKIGSLALGGLTLPQLLATQAIAKQNGIPVTDKAVIFLFMHGGPSQTETFDPKMDAPAGVRSATGEIKTAIPGITFGSTFPQLASLAKRFSIVRSFTTGDGNHNIKPIVCPETVNANLGSVYSRVAGTSNPDTGIPTNVVLFPQSVDASTQPGTNNFGRFDSTGMLGGGYAPFVPGAGGAMQEDMQLKLPLERVDDRRSLLQQLDAVRWRMEAAGGNEVLNKLREQAFGTILGGVADAFDLSKEDPRLVEKYDTSQIARPDNIDPVWKNYNNYVDNGKSLGKLLLLARRLCEAGSRFVTVTTNFVWDMHSDVNNAGVQEGMQYMGLPFDHAVAAFLEDVEARGLSEKILLVCCGEMGRTPKINAKGGRDHWGGLAPLLLAGGGLNMGQVIGQSDREAGRPATEPVTIRDLVATVLHTQFDVGQLRLVQGLPAEITRMINSGAPIQGLV